MNATRYVVHVISRAVNARRFEPAEFATVGEATDYANIWMRLGYGVQIFATEVR